MGRIHQHHFQASHLLAAPPAQEHGSAGALAPLSHTNNSGTAWESTLALKKKDVKYFVLSTLATLGFKGVCEQFVVRCFSENRGCGQHGSMLVTVSKDIYPRKVGFNNIRFFYLSGPFGIFGLNAQCVGGLTRSCKNPVLICYIACPECNHFFPMVKA